MDGKSVTADATEAYIQHPRVLEIIMQMKQKFGENYERLVVSDLIDDEGNQYVNLVQEGGGVLGVALVGYTFILETAGIRFFRVAGTSAGAINTTMMAVIGEKKDPKSIAVLNYLCKKNLFDFVDGHPFAKKLIGNFISGKDYVARIRRRFLALIQLFFILLIIDFVAIGLHRYFPQYSTLYITGFVFTGFVLGILVMIIGFLVFMLGSFKNSGYGINSGDDFLNWIKTIMHENGVDSITDFEAKAGEMPVGLKLREGRDDPEPLKGLVPDVTLITSEIISQNKIEFPKMWNLFTADKNKLHPAEFVRASMSIPLFFESYEINDIPVNNKDVIKSWYENLRVTEGCIPHSARFVDGGIISNFPISIFYNPKVSVARLPTFGIDLDDEEPKSADGPKAPDEMGLGSLLYRMFNTVRFNYDKDFLIKNDLYKRGIGKIKVYEFNWLNFGISDQEKINLFVRGAEAAADFLMGKEGNPGFDWEAYKNQRKEVQVEVSPSRKIN
jgi:NTE family protein